MSVCVENGAGDSGAGEGTGNRIRGRVVAACFPDGGENVFAMVYGEAPGPRGADQSGVPFWGDGAGIPLYRGLEKAGRVLIPAGVWEEWDGARLKALGWWPRLKGVALSNAYPVCPTEDGRRFRAPKRAELKAAENGERIRRELEQGMALGMRRVVTLGRCAAMTVGDVAGEWGLEVVALPHPSSQGLLMDAPGKGKGLRLADLRVAWEERLVAAMCAGA